MSSTSTRATQWIGFVGDLLRQPLTQMPHEAIVDLIRDTFDVTAASYNWAEADGRQGIVIHPVDTLEPLAEEFLAWQRGEFVGRHPLITWHQTVGDPRPSTNDRVPRAIVSNRERHPLIQMIKVIGCEQQLAINFRLSRPRLPQLRARPRRHRLHRRGPGRRRPDPAGRDRPGSAGGPVPAAGRIRPDPGGRGGSDRARAGRARSARRGPAPSGHRSSTRLLPAHGRQASRTHLPQARCPAIGSTRSGSPRSGTCRAHRPWPASP